ncbi:MAG: hypothetical protein EHM21_02935 [Chloroflexi bacterium]|nr:MAG: hypothetical protein EHM21_02935 [Chloroflexota bacterium]
MYLGVQFRGNVGANSARSWFTHSWPEQWRVVWMVVPTGPVQDRAPQLEWKVRAERQATNLIKYYLEIRNVSSTPVDVEARFAILE